ncbi:hypothetical protein AB6A40_007184 [Gnathostoma spinigerum]|uniref:Uncharacterized protein n=1 Tax=Gnathostoma spinigerum TaxID=75299 RepID=A0ABD6EW47_9BILA
MQAYLIVERFLRNDIIVGVELRFERIAFPAVTVCNLNPYKNSLARELGSMQETLRAFEDAIEQSSEDMKPQRRKRSTSINTITTRCTIEHDTHLVADPHGTLYCTCLSHGSLTWFCRKDTEWRDSFCSECNHETGTCIESIKYPNFPCKCHTDFCATIDHHLIRARWPLELSIMACQCKGSFCEATSVSGESGPEICHCISHSSSKPLCAAASRWQYAKCGHCLWNGQCMRSDDRNYEMDCLCIGDSMSQCFAVEDVNDDYERDVDLHRALRVRRENRRFYEKTERNSDLLAVFASCECPTNDTCKAIRENINSTNLCLCFYNKKNDVVWPCYPTDMWIEKRCKSCSFLGDCMYMEISGNIPCVCAPIIRMCVRIDGTNGGDSNWNDTFATSKITDSLSRRLAKIWEITTTTTPSLSAAKKEKLDKAFGLAGMNDPVAIKAKTTENLIYAANNLNTTEKEAISYRKEEFITKCSFNGRQCSIEESVIS